MKLILLGAPGAGKGSQAPFLQNKYGIVQISTGDAFRKNIKEGTPIGLYAKSFMDAGKLVPDETVVEIVASRIREEDCKNGFILDGFPRTIAQAEALGKITDIDYVIDFAVDTDILMKRLTGRRSCRKCGAVYHVSTFDGTACPKCGGEIYTRDDDCAETIANRIAVYTKETAPLKDFYAERGKLITVDAGRTIDEVSAEIGRKIK